MRIAIINSSENVGKTTIVNNLICPRFPDAEIFEIGEHNMQIIFKEIKKSPLDYFIIPVTTDEETMFNAIKISQLLSKLGIGGEKIHIILNRVPVDTEDADIKNVFSPIFTNTENLYVANPEVLMTENSVYTLLEKLDLNVHEFDEHPNNYREALKIADDEYQQGFFLFMMAHKQRALWAINRLNIIFDEIFEKEES